MDNFPTARNDYYQVIMITTGVDILETTDTDRLEILLNVLYEKKNNIVFLFNFREHAATGRNTSSFRAPFGMGRYEPEFL